MFLMQLKCINTEQIGHNYKRAMYSLHSKKHGLIQRMLGRLTWNPKAYLFDVEGQQGQPSEPTVLPSWKKETPPRIPTEKKDHGSDCEAESHEGNGRNNGVWFLPLVSSGQFLTLRAFTISFN